MIGIERNIGTSVHSAAAIVNAVERLVGGTCHWYPDNVSPAMFVQQDFMTQLAPRCRPSLTLIPEMKVLVGYNRDFLCEFVADQIGAPVRSYLCASEPPYLLAAVVLSLDVCVGEAIADGKMLLLRDASVFRSAVQTGVVVAIPLGDKDTLYLTHCEESPELKNVWKLSEAVLASLQPLTSRAISIPSLDADVLLPADWMCGMAVQREPGERNPLAVIADIVRMLKLRVHGAPSKGSVGKHDTLRLPVLATLVREGLSFPLWSAWIAKPQDRG